MYINIDIFLYACSLQLIKLTTFLKTIEVEILKIWVQIINVLGKRSIFEIKNIVHH